MGRLAPRSAPCALPGGACEGGRGAGSRLGRPRPAWDLAPSRLDGAAPLVLRPGGRARRVTPRKTPNNNNNNNNNYNYYYYYYYYSTTSLLLLPLLLLQRLLLLMLLLLLLLL